MKQYLKYNGLVAIFFLLFWALVALVDAKVGLYSLLGYILLPGSYPCVFVSFYVASWRALRKSSQHPVGFAALSSALMSPILIFLGVTLATNLELVFGDVRPF
jgi:hypothetical protein